jgi:hypothetical protein
VPRVSKKTWFRIHSFTGVITGLMLFVICWSGTFAVLSHELDWLVTPEARVEVGGGEPRSYGELMAAVQHHYPGVAISRIEAPLYARSAVQFVADLPEQASVRIYVDPYSGEILGAWSYFNIQRFFRSFHMELFLPYFGDYFVVLFALTMIVSLVAALYFYRRWWRRFFVFGTSARAFCSDTHKLAGLWSLWFLLVIAVTSAWYLFEMLRADVGDGRLSYASASAYGTHTIPAPDSDASLPRLPLDALVDRARVVRPDLRLESIGFDCDHPVPCQSTWYGTRGRQAMGGSRRAAMQGCRKPVPRAEISNRSALDQDSIGHSPAPLPTLIRAGATRGPGRRISAREDACLSHPVVTRQRPSHSVY